MFRSATFKLTMWYIALVMAISISFSFALYNVTTHELARGLSHEMQRIDNQFPIFQDNPLLKPAADYDDSAHRILYRLVGFNIIVLFGAGFASYWLARKTLEPIEAAHEQQKRFTSDVSHELRTPLTALRMESEVALLNDKSTLKELRQTLNSNLEEVSKLELLINNLLRLSQLEAEELQENFDILDTNKVVADAIDRVSKTSANHGIKLVNNVKDGSIYGDQDSLVQLLVILLDNSIKYSTRGSSVTINGGTEDEITTIKVVDEGIGIEPQALERVFDRFYRADSSRAKSDSEGYGLGLSIAKMISDMHDANLTISSKVGKGTAATITIRSVAKQQA